MWFIPLLMQVIMLKTIAIIGKIHSVNIAKILLDIAKFLKKYGYSIVLEQETAWHFILKNVEIMSLKQIGEHANLAIVVGGDGTMLGIARKLAPYNVPLIGINYGRLGFMTDISLDCIMPMLIEMLNGNVETESRSLLDAIVFRNEQLIFQALALNDIVISRGASSGMVELRVEVDGCFMYNQRSDGLVIATPTGSTAYALSAGGPILHPNLKGIVLVPIAPHALSNRPIAVHDSCEILVKINSHRETSANFDMQSFINLMFNDCLLVKRSRHNITFLHPKGWNYYDTLRNKLRWNEYPSEKNL